MPAIDPDPIPTEPTTEPRPPDANLFANGPSQAWGSPAAGRGRGPASGRLVTGLALALTFSVGIGVGLIAAPVLGDVDGTTPGPADGAAGDAFALIGEAWEILHQDYVGADELDDTSLAYGAIEGLADAVGDTGHTSFLTPEEREERSEEPAYQRPLRRRNKRPSAAARSVIACHCHGHRLPSCRQEGASSAAS